MDILLKIVNLRKQIERANYMYHTLDKPEISDYDYDQLLNELIELEAKYPQYDDPTSPSKRIGGIVLEGFKKHTHSVPMMSLSNVFNLEALNDFYERTQKIVPQFSVTAELKIDGLAVSLIYEKGIFVKAATRGNGVVGEDVTHNVRTIKSLPLKLSEPIDVEVRGEIYMSHHAFKKANEERMRLSQDLFANPRNAAAGTIRQLDSRVVAKRNLSLFVYQIVDAEKYANKQSDILKRLKKLGFPVNPHFETTASLDQLVTVIDAFDRLRKTLPYDTDGVVVKVDELDLYPKIGFTAKSPKYAVAYKFEAEKQETEIIDVTFQVGRTGVITPVAELKPVVISGSTVSRATLHNEDYMKSKDIRIGDFVLIHKAGEIIPEVIEVVLDKRKEQKPFEMINKCPVCHYDLERKEGEADYYCMNPTCPGKQVFSLIHFASRPAMDIDSLGEKAIELLYDLGYLQTISDIYKLQDHQTELEELPGFGKKSIEKILQAIEASKTQSFDRLIFGLGIKHVGAKVAKTLVKNYPNIEALKKAQFDDLILIAEIGPQIAQSVTEFFNNENNRVLVDDLKAFGLNMTYEVKTVDAHLFNGKTFVLTGTLETYSRDQAAALIEKYGGKVSSSVSSKTDYVLKGKEAGSKLRKAENLGIYIMDEGEFKQYINGK